VHFKTNQKEVQLVMHARVQRESERPLGKKSLSKTKKKKKKN
jgi:hypothetical protein